MAYGGISAGQVTFSMTQGAWGGVYGGVERRYMFVNLSALFYYQARESGGARDGWSELWTRRSKNLQVPQPD